MDAPQRFKLPRHLANSGLGHGSINNYLQMFRLPFLGEDRPNVGLRSNGYSSRSKQRNWSGSHWSTRRTWRSAQVLSTVYEGRERKESRECGDRPFLCQLWMKARKEWERMKGTSADFSKANVNANKAYWKRVLELRNGCRRIWVALNLGFYAVHLKRPTNATWAYSTVIMCFEMVYVAKCEAKLACVKTTVRTTQIRYIPGRGSKNNVNNQILPLGSSPLPTFLKEKGIGLVPIFI